MQLAVALFNVPILHIVLERQRKQFEKKAIGFETGSINKQAQ